MKSARVAAGAAQRVKKALVVAGHGSHISPETAGLVWHQVDRLRAMRIADEVTAAFWKEMPSFSSVLHSLSADDVTIVPLFTARGYFTGTVIPAEMQLEGAITRRDGRILRYARPLGEHPYQRDIVLRRVKETLRAIGAPADQVGVAIIGHGTQRSPKSRAATEALAQTLREFGLVGQVAAVFLDDEPAIPAAYDLLQTPVIIAIPNFLALGSHTTLDVPRELGLAPGQTSGNVRGRSVYYTDPVGLDASLCDAILELAREAGASLNTPNPGTGWDSFPAAGRDELIQAVQQQGELHFGQLVLTPTEVYSAGDRTETITHPPALRQRVRMQPIFRPLATAADLPGGWRVPIDEPGKLAAVVETVYPGALADWAAGQKRTFTIQPLEAVVARQTGMYKALANFNRTAECVARICAGCVRHPTWYHGESPVEAIPCREPCNWWMSRALETE